MSFQFGFSGDDVDDDNDDGQTQTSGKMGGSSSIIQDNDAVEKLPVRKWNVEELLNYLPDRLSFSKIRIESPLGKVAMLPRRELFDVRMQLLSEGSAADDGLVDQLDTSDLRAGVYEGGFKTWECSLDLASLLLDRGPRKDIDELVRCDQVVELGAGSAIPTLVLFRHAITNQMGDITFTLADYNDEVLRYVTFPNVFLTWALASQTPMHIDQSETKSANQSTEGEEEMEITAELKHSFVEFLSNTRLSLNFLSGAWSPALAAQISPSAPNMGLVVLAAETIYSPASTEAFVEMLVLLLRRVKMAKAMVAAKRMYFGVGGSVDGLKEACRDKGAIAYEIENHGVPGLRAGVGRALMEVQMF